MHIGNTGVRLSRALDSAWHRLLSVAIVPLLASTACSETSTGAGHGTRQLANGDGATTMGPHDAGPGEPLHPARCGDAPVRLVDYVSYLPDAAQGDIGAPAIGVNGDGLFYLFIGAAEGPGGFVMHLPDGASEPVRLATVPGGGSGGRQGLAVTQTAAIFSEAGDYGEDSQGAVLSVSPGEEPTTLASTAGLAFALVADEQNVYFADDEGTKSVPLTGGPVRTLADQTAISAIMVAGSTLYLAVGGQPGSLSSVPIDGGPVTVLATESPLQMVMCGQSVCWLTGSPYDMRLRQLVPGGRPATLATGLVKPHDLVFDGRHFFVTEGFGSLTRIPAAGGTPDGSIDAVGLGASSLALDDACLYWSQVDGIYSVALSATGQAPGH